MLVAIMAVPKIKDNNACPRATLRKFLDVKLVSETW
jgi:hypothetical protein